MRLLHHTPDLDDLLNLHASDKQSQNGYGPIYHALFKHLRDQPINLLEIGIGTLLPNVYCSMYGHDLPGYKPGASLRAWRDYFVEGTIYGIDVQPDTMIKDERNIVTALVDSRDADSVNTFMRDGRSYGLVSPSNFDIIVDDGSHIAAEQLATLTNLWPYLAQNGLYVIEDVNRIDHNQGRILVDHIDTFNVLMKQFDALYFTVSLPKADMIIISARDCR